VSAGDKNDPDPFTYEQAKAIVGLDIVRPLMRRMYAVNSSDWDIPYLAGYSKDGKTIYIDRDLSRWLYMGRMIDTDRFLKLHEHVEKALIDAIQQNEDAQRAELLRLLRMKTATNQIYYHCHGVATALEEYAVKLTYGALGLDSYNRFMATQVKDAEDERILRVPADLDMTPYQGTDKMDRRLRDVMRKHMEA